MMGSLTEKISIEKVLTGCNVKYIKQANPLHLQTAIAAVSEAVAFPGVSVVLFEAPCIALFKPKLKRQVDKEHCTGCRRCVKEIGCPAISLDEKGKARIDTALCYGCSLCTQVCPAKAIGGTPL